MVPDARPIRRAAAHLLSPARATLVVGLGVLLVLSALHTESSLGIAAQHWARADSSGAALPGAGSAVMPREALVTHALLAAPTRVEASEVACEEPGLTGGPTCVFRRLYLYNDQLHFVVPAGVDAAAFTFSDAGLVLSNDIANGGWGGLLYPRVRPRVVDVAAVEAWAGGVPVAAYTDLPLVLVSRLNPTNVYHRIWDDMAQVHALVCRALALFAVAAGAAHADAVPPLSAFAAAVAQAAGRHSGSSATWGGCTAGTVPPVALGFVDGFHASDLSDWLATTAEEVHTEWPLTVQHGVVKFVPFLVVGSQGACMHAQFCSNELATAPLLHFKRHFGAVWRLPTELPMTLHAPRVVVFVQRVGRRQITNTPELAAAFRKWGWEVRMVGPFQGVPLVTQIAAFANASAAVLAVGAEMGIAWLGLPAGACAIVASPANAQDGLAGWIASKLGINVASVVESIVSPSDPRIGQAMGKTYQSDIRISVRELRDVAWCLNQAPAGTRGMGFPTLYSFPD